MLQLPAVNEGLMNTPFDVARSLAVVSQSDRCRVDGVDLRERLVSDAIAYHEMVTPVVLPVVPPLPS